MTTYHERPIWDYPELQEPSLMEWRRCECGYVGDMPMRQISSRCPETIESPEEPAEYVATCPRCELEHDEYGDSS